MTRKHYVAVAAVIRETLADWPSGLTDSSVRLAVERIAEGLASEFAEDNPRFDRGRFLAACGLGE